MNQRMSSTDLVYTPGRPAASRGAPAVRSRAPGAGRSLVALLAATAAAGAPAEELIRVRAPSSGEILELRLEEYVAGVVSGEMPASFPPEALKAQAVAARSYALTRKIDAQIAGRGHDIASGVVAQVWAERASEAARAAAAATAGEVLVAGRDPVEAYFHASCGGRTEAGLPALGRDLPYLLAVECGRCDRSPAVRWRIAVGARELAAAAGLRGKASAARVVARSPSGRAERLEIEAGRRGASISAVDLRRKIGWSRLPSLAFEVRRAGAAFAFEGRGRGHGAGLCQWGAAGLAREGKGYREILAHYYPGAAVVRMY
jgi:stage II sporulation protein D